MKIKSLTIQNIGPIADAVIEFNKPLNLFFGEVRQGKTTVLNCIRWLWGGAFPEDIIKHGADWGLIRLDIEGGYIERRFRVDAKTGKVVADLTYCKDGNPKAVPDPVVQLRKLANPFFKDQDYLRNMGETDRKRFFVDYLHVDTRELDQEREDLKKQQTELQAKIDGYGDIDLTPVEQVDVAALRQQVADAKKQHSTRIQMLNKKLAGLRAERDGGKRKELRDAQAEQETLLERHTNQQAKVVALREELAKAEAFEKELEKKLEISGKTVAAIEAEVAALPDLKPEEDRIQKEIAAPLDTSALESQIEQAIQANERFKVYEANVARDAQRKTDNELLKYVKDRVLEIRDEKAKKLADIAEGSGIEGLAFDENGDFLYQGVTAGMLSTSQLVRLSSAIAAQYPEGLGIELLDRAESLGEAIFTYVDRAKEKQLTILATIVGERPANVPEGVGVFVVKAGSVRPGSVTP